jgi:riboflavin synthase
MNQTLERDRARRLERGARVNLELAMKASDRLGGHIVQGHVDGVGEVVSSRTTASPRLRVALGPS